MKKFFSDNWLALVITLAFITSTITAIRNGYVIDHNHKLLQQTEQVTQNTEAILSDIMHGLDLGVRGFGLTLDEKLLNPYEKAITAAPTIFSKLDSLLEQEGYQDRGKLQSVRSKINSYIDFSNEMIALAKEGKMDEFKAKLKEDRGYDVWFEYNQFAAPLFEHQDKLNTLALAEYKQAITLNLVLQGAILVLVLPLLFVFLSQIRKERNARGLLLKEVEVTDRSFVFNDGENTNHLTEEINKRSMAHVKQASEFIAAITEGNYEVTWKGLTQENEDLNKLTLAGNLVHLRENLKKVRRDEERRNWVNEGIAQFSEIVRIQQHQGDQFYHKILSFLVRYINAQQGSLFIEEIENGEPILNLTACYAFDKRKWIAKKIEIGNGLIGQAYLEGTPVILKQVPVNYVSITSGLGLASPRFLVIIPMKYDDKTVAVMEFAGFEELQEYQIQFLEKTGEYLASAITSTRTTSKMKQLLEEAAMREQQMKQREEELSQNMEELQAIQEEMHRKQKDVMQQQHLNLN